MGIVFLLVSGFLFHLRIKHEKRRDYLMIWGAVLLYFCFSLFLNWYMRSVLGWENGISGSDLLTYFRAAKAIANGTGIDQLVRIHEVFDGSFTNLGYLIYVIFIFATAFIPVIFNLEISLQILYCIQAFAAIAAALNIADFFAPANSGGIIYDTRLRNKILWMLLLCTSVLQASTVLMRDIWILFFISCLLQECKKKNKVSLVACIILIIVCLTFRLYTLIITIPIFLAFRFKKKTLAAVVSVAFFSLFFLGQGLIRNIATAVGIGWEYDFHFTINSLLSYILFPNIINQSQNVLNIRTGYHVYFGGNTGWIYYLLSCWNVFVYPLSAYGIYKSIRSGEGKDALIWGMMIINIAMMISLFYSGVTSPRHKLLIIICTAYFFKKGIENMKQLSRLIYGIVVIIGLLCILAIA